MSVVACTSFTLAELAGALALARGVKARHPDWRVCGVLVDRAPADAPWRAAFDEILDAQDLYGEAFAAFAFAHEASQAPAAARGRALSRLLEGADKAFYFSPHIAVYDDLGALAEQLEHASVLLTPHHCAPSQTPRAYADNEARALEDGVYNLGFLGLRNDAAGRAFARWQTARLEANADDAKSFDLAPALFDRVGVLRDPGCHVARWNLVGRAIAIRLDGRIVVNGAHSLKFCNFADPRGDGGLIAERYAGRDLAFYELAAHYARALAAAGAPVTGEGWAYARFSDKTPIPAAARRLYRREPDLRARFPDPFDAGPDGYLAYLRANRPDAL